MPTHTTDADLVTGHLAGDPAALAGIYDRYADTLHDTAAAMLNDRTEAADVLQDTILIAAERLGQLRDPERLKPWLFAILRNEVYRRSKKRRRTIATDFSGGEDGFDMADDRQIDAADAVSDAMAGDEFASLLRGAARGLDERDQLVLELSVRQGLEGQDLADALGVSANQSYTLVHRMRERVERSLGAYAIAKAGRKDCDDLDSILAKWDGEFTVLIRKRVARHIDNCTTCSTNRSKVAPLALFAGAPAFAAPPELRDKILQKAGGVVPKHSYGFTATDGFPEVLGGARRFGAWIAPTAAASIMVVAGVLGFLWLSGDDGSDGDLLASATSSTTTTIAETTTTTVAPTTTVVATAPADTSTSSTSSTSTTSTAPTTSTTTSTSTTTTTTVPVTTPPVTAPPPPPPTTAPPPPPTTQPPTTPPPRPGQLSIASSVIDLGRSSPSGATTISNVGDLPVNYAISGDTGPFSVGPLSGTLGGGESVSVIASIDRSNLPEGVQQIASLQVTGDGTVRSLSVVAQVERPPVLGAVNGPQSGCAIFASSQQLFISADVAASDESPPLSLTFSVSGPNGLSGSSAMIFDINRYFGAVQFTISGSSQVNGTWNWTINATDARGNSTSAGGTHTVSC